MNRRQLEELSRDELIARAERLGVPRPRVLTQVEIVDEILARTAKSADEKRKTRGFLGRARDLLASVLELGLHLPEAAKVLRDRPAPRSWPAPPTPVPTITLAEIYAAQGHLQKAIGVLDELLAGEPAHAEAAALRTRLARDLEASAAARTPTAPPAPPPDASLAADEAGDDDGPAPGLASEVEPTTDERGAPADVLAEAPDAPQAASLAAASLPDRYDVDEVVAVAVDPATLYIYWEIRPRSLAHARVASPEGKVVLRVITIAPSWDGPEVVTRDFVVDELLGERFVRDLPAGADARVSVGWQFRGGYDPFAVGMELTMPRGEPSKQVAHATARWSREPSPVELASVRLEMFQGAVAPSRVGPADPLSLSWTGAPGLAPSQSGTVSELAAGPVRAAGAASPRGFGASSTASPSVPVRVAVRPGGSSGLGGASGAPSRASS